VEFPVVPLGTVLCRFDTYIFLTGDKNGYWKPCRCQIPLLVGNVRLEEVKRENIGKVLSTYQILC